MMKLICDEKQKCIKLFCSENLFVITFLLQWKSKIQIVTKLKNSNCNKTQNSICDKTKKN